MYLWPESVKYRKGIVVMYEEFYKILIYIMHNFIKKLKLTMDVGLKIIT